MVIWRAPQVDEHSESLSAALLRQSFRCSGRKGGITTFVAAVNAEMQYGGVVVQ
jgi:hypothetical protein